MRRHRAHPPVVIRIVLTLLAAAGPLAGCGSAGRAAAPRVPPPTRVPTVSAPSGTAASGSPSGPASAAASVPRLDHVVLVVMENLGYDAALADPRLAALAAGGARADRYDAVAHPSLPNYLALDTGSTHGISSDCTDCYVSGPDLGQQLSAAGDSWGGYMEALPSPCYLGGSAGSYAAKHDPFRYLTAIRSNRELCGHIRPLSDLDRAVAGPAGALPRFAWVTPDICHDGHDCGAATAGSWLTGFVHRVEASPSWNARSALFVTWDEAEDGDSRGGGGHVLTFVRSPAVTPGLRVAVPSDHYALLRTIEEALGLPLLGHAADPGRPDLAAFWSGPG